MKRKFWNWLKNEGKRELRIEGTIADESWLDNEIDPKIFRNELNSGEGKITVWINSYGGDVFAASQIYTMLMEYKGEVTVKIDGIAASAASVIAMAGGSVEMSPTSMMMIHDPMTISIGNSEEMKAAIKMLGEVKESIISAYELKTGLTRDRISQMMSAETWMNAKKAQELGFADKILYEGDEVEDSDEGLIYSRMAVTNSLLDRIKHRTFDNQIEHKNIEINTKSKGMVKMDKLTLLDKRANLWEEMKNFLDSHTKNGKLSKEDAATYNRMEDDFDALTKNIERYEKRAQIDIQMNSPTSQPILSQRGSFDPFFNKANHGVASKEYRKDFANQIRAGFRNAPYNYLKEASPQLGGYLLPTEFHEKIITELQSENIFRTISKTITTESEHRIVIQTQKPVAEFFGEGAAIDFNKPEFAQKAIGAHKLACAVKISNELLADSFYDLEGFLAGEFSKALALKEEDSFLNGDGVDKPLGIIPQLGASATGAITAAGSKLTADDLLNLVHSLGRPYRKKAVFVMNDATLATIRKFKDNNNGYLWQPSLRENEPDRLFGVPIYTSSFMPTVSGEITVLYGDFANCHIIGQRGEMSFQPLRELFAGNDLTGFLLIERVDAIISDTAGIRGLKLR